MNKISIEKTQLPSPTKKTSSPYDNPEGHLLLAGLRKLNIGESFFLPAENFSSKRYAQIKTCQRAKLAGIRAVLRDETKSGVKGYRFYRIA